MNLDYFNKLYTEFLTPEHELYAGHMLLRAAEMWPAHIALIGPDQQVTFSQLYEQASALSVYLQQQHIMPGNKVMIVHENSLDFYRAYHGAWQIGAVVIPVNTFMHEKELEHVINDSKPDVLIVSEKIARKIASIRLYGTIIIDQEALQKLISQPAQQGCVAVLHKQAPHDLSVLLYTSGTTGLPKGVMLSSYNCIYNSIQAIAEFRSQPDDKILCALPLFHSFTQNGCVWSSCLLGTTVIIVPKIDRKLLRAGIAHKPTLIVGVPQLFALFCLMKQIDFSTVRFFICGGDALSDKIRYSFELLFGRKLCNGYGLTEASPFISVDLDDIRSESNTVGRPFIGIAIEIRDEDSNPVKQGIIGTLWIKGNNVMLGYYNAPEATAAILRDGWLNTGDAVRLTKAHKLVVCGREKDLIINKGIKIYPQEIENCLMMHTAVQGVAVISEQNGNDEQIPVAYIVTDSSENKEKLIHDLMTLLKEHLATYKIPRRYIIVDELPTTSTGKIDKKLLRARHD